MNNWLDIKNNKLCEGKKHNSNLIKNKIGQTFGGYTIIGYVGKSKWSVPKWNCRCVCGLEKVISGAGLNKKKNKEGCANCRIKSYGEMHLRYFHNLRRKAGYRKIKWNLSPKYIWELFIKQNKKCALSGVDICFVRNFRNNKEQTASLDRIDSSKGYTKNNIQWVHKKINFMKQALEDDQFIFFCTKVAENNS